ncbi:hypothetical protein EJ04DRAFT_513274 [Polyplosphaeria fusca]|uniref:Uncharacterized protein n=1 Tax=Polyplosphaeria fusca TaxID=682080 RepID=A0A9P4V1J6_9PLEO|nr:hypothetical protein EJ04DRAFT_513274 [Polyplosphaeria fusca]
MPPVAHLISKDSVEGFPHKNRLISPRQGADLSYHLNGGQIAGIIFGTLAVLVIAVGLYIWGRRENTKYRPKKRTGQSGPA